MERTEVISTAAALARDLHDELQRMEKDYDLGRLPSAHETIAKSVELLDAIAGNLHRLIEMARDDGLETDNFDFARMRASRPPALKLASVHVFFVHQPKRYPHRHKTLLDVRRGDTLHWTVGGRNQRPTVSDVFISRSWPPFPEGRAVPFGRWFLEQHRVT